MRSLTVKTGLLMFRQWMMLDWKPRRSDMLIDPFGIGKIVQDGLVFSENFSIRSYEIGADRTASIDTIMNHLQETALNHVKIVGLLGDGFGSTPEMCKKNLIWVVARMQVAVDRYPTCWPIVVVGKLIPVPATPVNNYFR
ncbi:palmitoyl-acyl carrier protein thioesterase, chloroplastic-like [Vicia villosa]|uniref:palmitoyl-acyl carrier protein thioesterase, chloroplastic-like n=1 Tax=Vicia villosa TaxID=3911 RepID=UPI00273ABF1F|nr:palmitoyl-acyl carrier protein thioesterase, chloroplastic-like [Vicia villosa]